MSYGIEPVETADAVLQSMFFSDEPAADEFTINKYYHQLTELKRKRRLSDREYAALGVLLFQKRRLSAFLNVMEEARLRFPDSVYLRAVETVGRLSVARLENVIDSFDLYASWFDPEKNPDRLPLSFFHKAKGSTAPAAPREFAAPLSVTVSLGADGDVILASGPLSLKTTIDAVRANRYGFDEMLLHELVERIRAGELTRDVNNYVRFVFGDVAFDSFYAYWSAEPTDEVKAYCAGGYETDDVETCDSVEDLLNTLEGLHAGAPARRAF